MKKKILSVAAVLAGLSILTACGKTDTKTNSTPPAPQKTTQTPTEPADEETTEEETKPETEETTEEPAEEETAPETTEPETEPETETEEKTENSEENNSENNSSEITDSSSTLTESSEGLVWDTGVCTIPFPQSWKDRIIIKDNAVYSKKCWEDNENTGKMFTIVSLTADELTEGPRYSYILGTANGKYVLPILPTDADYDISNSELSNDYMNLSNDLQNIFPRARCKSSPDFQPLQVSEYDYPSFTDEQILNGTWESMEEPAGQFSPYVIFDKNSGKFGWHNQMQNIDMGAFWVNNSGNEWDTTNGLVFINGNIYKVTYYSSAPVTMNFENLTGKNDELAKQTYQMWSDGTDFSIDNYD